MSTQHPVRYSHRVHLAAGQKPQYLTPGWHDEGGVMMAFDIVANEVSHA